MSDPVSESAHYVTDRLGGRAVVLVQEGRIETPGVTRIRWAQDAQLRATRWTRWLRFRRRPTGRAAA